MRVHHTIDGGGDRPLVLCNAIGTTTALWERQMPALTRHFTVIRSDLRGHGGSAVGDGVRSLADLAGDVLELLDDLEIERAAFAGVSLGGNIAMWIAVNAPQRVDRLVLACTSAAFGVPQSWVERAAKVRASGTESIAEMSIQRWFTTRTRIEDPAVVERFRAALIEVNDEGYAGCCDALAGWSFVDELPGIAAPTLVIAGADDPASPPAHGQVMVDGIPDARMRVLEGAAHLANVDAPAPFTRLMLDHLQATTAGHKEHA